MLTSLRPGRHDHLKKVGVIDAHVGEGEAELLRHLPHEPLELVRHGRLVDIHALLRAHRQVLHRVPA
jgi:hypothetical protein